ncbi:MAG: hypothetical protein ACXV49_10185 [Halobacteriota archaeon]
MKKTFLAVILAMVLLVVVSAAGCVSPTTTSPTPSAASTTATTTQNVSQYLTQMMQQRNFTVVQPFSPQPNTQAGISVYNGTVSDQNGTYNVSVLAANSSQLAQQQFTMYRAMYMGWGYSQVQANATVWSGFNASTQRGANVEYGTSPLIPSYVMVISGGSTGQRTYQQSMWQHMLDEMDEHMGSNGGPGSYMGQGMTSDMRSHMQQEMQEHMGSGGMMEPGMMGGNTT